AAGNDGADSTKAFPANCLGVVTVGAVKRDQRIATYSNYGPNVGILAPGGDDWGLNTIATLSNTGSDNVGDPAYDFESGVGTSFAAPYVAAAAAYIRGISPTITQPQIAYLFASTGLITGDERCAPDFENQTNECAPLVLDLAR
ncbi:MAG: S8 family serine peptidase, partial [Candidatus Fonsibacter sp.]